MFGEGRRCAEVETLTMIDPKRDRRSIVASSPIHSATVCLPSPRAIATIDAIRSWSVLSVVQARMNSPSILIMS